MTIYNNPNSVQLSVQHTSSPKVDISVKKTTDNRQTQSDIERLDQIPPDEIKTDLPDSNVPEGNTMKCLQNMLLEAAGYNISRMDETEKLDVFKKLQDDGVVKRIKGKYLKDGGQADSSPIADVHHDDKTGENYIKYLVTWEIDVVINGNQVTLKKTQWIVTGVKVPNRFDSPKFVRQRLYFAFLALKLHISTHKAALDPANAQYEHVNKCITDLMKTNLCGYEGYVKENRLGFSGEEYGSGVAKFRPTTVSADRPANTLAVVLFDDSGEKMVLFTNQSKTERTIGDKEISLSSKRFEQALDTVFRYPEFAKHQEIMEADPNEILDLINKSRLEGKNLRGLEPHERASELYNGILSQHSTMDRNAKLKETELLGETLGMYFTHRPGPSTMLKGLGYATGLINVNYGNTKGCLDDLKFSELDDKEKKKIEDLVKKYREKVDILKTNEERVNRIKLHLLTEDKANLSANKQKRAQKDIDLLQNQIESGEVPKSGELKKHEKVLEHFEKWINAETG